MAGSRFLTDTSLEAFARRLRLLGYDVVTLHGARLEQLLDAARTSGRTVLTLSARHPKRFRDVPAIVVGRGDPMGSLRAIAETGVPAGPPFSRCCFCNHPLERRPSSEASGAAPDEVVWSTPRLDHCAACGRWYWHGSHVDRVREWFEEALGGPLAPPEV